jgi:hypothetical protein
VVGGAPVLEQKLDALQRAGPVRDHPGRIGQCGEHAAGDASAGFLPTTLADLA